MSAAEEEKRGRKKETYVGFETPGGGRLPEEDPIRHYNGLQISPGFKRNHAFK